MPAASCGMFRQLLGKSLKFIDMLPVLIFSGAPAVHSSELCGQESKYTALMPSVVGTMRLVVTFKKNDLVLTFLRQMIFYSDFTRIYEAKSLEEVALFFIGPRCPWGPIYGSGSLSLTNSKTFVQIKLM